MHTIRVPRRWNSHFRYLALAASIPLLLLLGMRSLNFAPDRPAGGRAVAELDREIRHSGNDARYRATLRGLRWCVTFVQNEDNFDFTFSNYVTMLDELTLHHPRPGMMRIVHELIVNEFERAIPRLPRIFPADPDGYETFVSILPIAYHHQIPLEPLKAFAARQFANVTPADRMEEFRRWVKRNDYDRLTDIVVGATFIDMAYRWRADREFRLPPDIYPAVLAECGRIPLLKKEGEDGYFDQNYYVTHLLLALNHYGQRKLAVSPIADRVFFYLVREYEAVRNRSGDIDLLCEYLYCLRQFGPKGVGFIDEGERYVMSRQRPDGAWGNVEAKENDPYDRLHPTWTAITLLAQGE